jgi:hypothetical protein
VDRSQASRSDFFACGASRSDRQSTQKKKYESQPPPREPIGFGCCVLEDIERWRWFSSLVGFDRCKSGKKNKNKTRPRAPHDREDLWLRVAGDCEAARVRLERLLAPCQLGPAHLGSRGRAARSRPRGALVPASLDHRQSLWSGAQIALQFWSFLSVQFAGFHSNFDRY